MLRVLALAFLVSSASAQVADTLHASLDLREAVAAGWIDPATETVGLRGSLAPLSWDATLPAADPDGDGLYHLAVPFALDGDSARVELKIKIDDLDRNAPNGGWQEGRNHAVTIRRGEGADLALAWADRPPVPPATVVGRVDRIEAVGGGGMAPRDVFVYLPPGYADSDRRYPVLYLHDGDNAFGAVPGASEWTMDEAAEALIEAGEIAPLVIVGVASTEARMDEYTPTARHWEQTARRLGPPTASGSLGAITGTYGVGTDSLVVALRDGVLMLDPPEIVAWIPMQARGDGTYGLPGDDVTLAFPTDETGTVMRVTATRPPAGGRGDAYGAFLIDVVKPMIDARYRTRPEAAHTGLGGVSLGGLITMHLGITRPDVFGRLLVASPSVWWDDRALLTTVAEATPPAGQRVWVDIGAAEGDTMVPDARRLAALLVETGWDPSLVRFVEAHDAGHDWEAWAARAPDMLRFLFPPE